SLHRVVGLGEGLSRRENPFHCACCHGRYFTNRLAKYASPGAAGRARSLPGGRISGPGSCRRTAEGGPHPLDADRPCVSAPLGARLKCASAQLSSARSPRLAPLSFENSPRRVSTVRSFFCSAVAW